MGNLFAFVTHPMELGLIWLANLVGSAGIGIILFTIFVRLVLSPLTITQLRNARNMQKLQPLMQELRQKHGKDKQQLQAAMMELYREHNVNPAMGCLPMVLQFPILIGLFYALLHLGQTPFTTIGKRTVFKNDVCSGHKVTQFGDWLHRCYSVAGTSVDPHHYYNLFHAQFLWLDRGLGNPDPLFILPVLAGVTQWIQSRMMLTKTTDPQAQTMNTMMNFMPLIIVFFALRYASGLSLYWVTSTIIGILIQYRITGLGLLPRPATVMAFLGGVGSARSAGQRPAPRRAAPPPSSKPVQPTTNGLTADGQNGTGNKPAPKGSAARPRKANRGKGGRGGGRRG